MEKPAWHEGMCKDIYKTAMNKAQEQGYLGIMKRRNGIDSQKCSDLIMQTYKSATTRTAVESFTKWYVTGYCILFCASFKNY